MSHDKFNDTLISLLDAGRVNHVISNLRSRLNASVKDFPDLAPLSTELDSISNTYFNMRQFLMTGLPDPDLQSMYDSIKKSLRNIGRQYLFIINQNRLDPLFAEYRLRKVSPETLELLFTDLQKTEFHIDKARETEADSISFVKKKEDIIDRIFRRVWSLPPSSSDELSLLSSRLNDVEISFALKSQIVSALLLSLLKFNDPAKFLLLLNSYNTIEDERLEARLLMAIVLVLARWGKSAVIDNEIKEALQMLADSIMTYTRLREVVMTIIRTRDTDRVSREIDEAFSSTMKEITPEMIEKLRKDGISVDASETGMNPEWEKLMKNTDLEEKMKVINNMQLEGMDVMMQTFSRLKSFQFFQSVSNWFLPFSINHSEVAPLFLTFNKDVFWAMADATEMCSGDRYSFVLGILQMPESRRNLLAANIGTSLEMIKDQIKDRENVRRRSLFATEVLSFSRDLYRFAKIYPKHSSFYNPFEQPLDLRSLPVIGDLITETEILVTAADFYFQHAYYSLALPLYEGSINSGNAERHIFEKIGYCNQMLADYHGALQSYEKADLFSSDTDRSSAWLLKRLAFCNKALGRYGKAADYYRKLLERNPEDLSLEFHLACVLLRSGELKEARELISKVHYIDPSHQICNRIYSRLKGHDAFFAGSYREAIELYKSARGDQNWSDYVCDLVSEISQLYPHADTMLFSILLDE